MTKARYLLLCFIDKRKLKDICRHLNVSYKYVHSIAMGKCQPSMRLALACTSLIDMNFWAEEVTEEFKKIYDERIDSIYDNIS